MPKNSSKSASRAQVSPVIAVRECEFKFTPSQRLVLYALASRMQSFEHDVWPSMATIAADTSLSMNQSRRVVHELVDLGILIEQETNRRTKTYRMVLPCTPMVGVQSPKMGDSHGGGIPSHGGSVDSHDGSPTPPMVGVEVEREGQREETREDTTRIATARVVGVVPPALPLTTIELDVLRTIVTTPELSHPSP